MSHKRERFVLANCRCLSKIHPVLKNKNKENLYEVHMRDGGGMAYTGGHIT